MGPIIGAGMDSGFVDWIPKYWPWSGYLVLLWLFFLYVYLFLDWWEDKKNKKKVYKILYRVQNLYQAFTSKSK